MAISTISNANAVTYAGAVLQVVNATASTQVTVNTSTYTDTTLTATITPKFSTSKILVIVSQPYAITSVATTASIYAGIQILRNSTVIFSGVADSGGPYSLGFGSNTSINPSQRTLYSATVLDSPATTSSVTYKTQARRYNSNSAITLQETDNGGGSVSTITLMEIAA